MLSNGCCIGVITGWGSKHYKGSSTRTWMLISTSLWIWYALLTAVSSKTICHISVVFPVISWVDFNLIIVCRESPPWYLYVGSHRQLSRLPGPFCRCYCLASHCPGFFIVFREGNDSHLWCVLFGNWIWWNFCSGFPPGSNVLFCECNRPHLMRPGWALVTLATRTSGWRRIWSVRFCAGMIRYFLRRFSAFWALRILCYIVKCSLPNVLTELTLAWKYYSHVIHGLYLQVINVELPIIVIVKVVQTDPGLKGDTAQGMLSV